MIKVSALEIFERFNDSPKEQLELAQLIFRCGIRGDEIKSDNLAVDIAAKAILKDSFLSRENYKQRCERTAKYGIQGKEYGIEGKEHGIEGKDYGPLGGEYGPLGGRPRKRPDVFTKIYNFIMSDENYLKSALSEDKTQNRMLRRNIKARIPEVTENNDENSKLINGVIKKIKEENINNNNGDNKVQ